MSRSRVNFRILFAAFGLTLCAAVEPIQAQTLVSSSTFSLTYPAGWQKFALGGKADSTGATVMNMTNGAASFLFGVPHQGALTTAEIAAAMAQYGAGDSLAVTTQGTKTLGGK